MAIMITTEYQEISSISLDYGSVKTYAKYTNQSRESNKTTYWIKAVYYNPNYNVSFSSANLNLDGTTKSYGYTEFSKGQTLLEETWREMTHNEDGSSLVKNIATSWNASYGGSGSANADIYFPPIQRYSIISSASNFNDEENPSITFSNNGLYGLRAKILVGETEIYSQDLVGNETSYIFELTQTQRNQLRQLCTGKTLNVTLAICSINNNQIVYTSSQNVVMSIVNANPTFTYTVEESNQNVIDFLGTSSANQIISNVSVLAFTVVPTAYKQATILQVWVTNGSLKATKTTSPYEIRIHGTTIKTNSFTIGVNDSRDFSSSQEDNQRTLVDYKIIKINQYSFVRESPTSNNIILNLESVYYDTVGNIQNTPVVKWKLDDGSYTTIPSSNYVIDTTNNTLKIVNYELTNALSYQSTGQFTIYVEDRLTNAQDSGENGKVLKGVATFDVGEHDMQINGDLYIADTNRENAINVKQAIQGIDKGVLLWTNTNPTASFNSQNVSISNLKEYKIFDVYFARNTTNDSVQCVRVYNNALNVTHQYGCGGSFAFFENGSTYIASRQFTIGPNGSNPNRVTFANGYLNTSTDNTRAIPRFIVGYKTTIFD